MATPDTLTIERRLTASQAERRDRVRDAARALASEGGYPAVTMQAVAERSGVARATIYRYFASKDHLLAEVVLDWGREIARDLRTSLPAGGGVPARISAVLKRVVEVASAEPQLTAAVLAAATSPDPEAIRAQSDFASLLPAFFDEAIGETRVEARQEREKILEHVFFSVLLNLTSGRIAIDDATATLDAAASRLFTSGREE